MTRKEIIGFYNGGFMSEILLAHLVGRRRDARAILRACGLDPNGFAERYRSIRLGRFRPKRKISA